jgi:hypothetical protein
VEKVEPHNQQIEITSGEKTHRGEGGEHYSDEREGGIRKVCAAARNPMLNFKQN